MRVLITGHDGYIGSVLSPMARDAGHDVIGLDTFWFQDCGFGTEPDAVPSITRDIRDVTSSDLEGFDAIVHLAAVSNDPLGDLDPKATYEINHRATVQLASFAREVGVTRFIFSSSCSLYGAGSTDQLLSETAPFSPVTPYAESKVLVEHDVSLLASDDFSPIFLRNATVYGISPRLRLDLVLNDLVASAYTRGEISLKSDGTPWRPLVHVEDVATAFLAALSAPRDSVHGQAFNIGRTAENYRVRDLAELVAANIDGSRVTFAEGAGPDPRSYRVDFSKAESSLPGFRPKWSVAAGVDELRKSFQRNGLDTETVDGPRYIRLRRIQELIDSRRLGVGLRSATTEPQGVSTLQG